MQPSENVIHLEGVSKVYKGPAGDIHALKDVNLAVKPGEFVGVKGPSGSGKSTLLNMITGIDHPSEGNVTVAGTSIVNMSENQLAHWRGRQVGVIFQFFQLLPTLSIVENVMLPMDFCRTYKTKERPERAMYLLEQVGLADQAHKLPSTLSGGQMQRAAIARALANDPPLIVADEPTGNLDSKTADRIFRLFEDLVDRGRTFLMVTHDDNLATRIPRVLRVLDGVMYDDVNPDYDERVRYEQVRDENADEKKGFEGVNGKHGVNGKNGVKRYDENRVAQSMA